jgi:hypothetical protein
MPDSQDDNKIAVDAEEISAQIKEKVIADVTPELTEKIIAEVTDEVAKEAAEKATKATKEEIVRKISGDKAVDENAAPWVKENRNPRSYEEVAEYGRQQAVKDFEAKQKARDEAAAKVSAEEKKTSEEKQKQWNKYWDKQLKEMEDKEMLPKMDEKVAEKFAKGETLTSEDQQDPGIRARADIFAKAKELKETNLKVVYYEHFANKKPSGWKAPVFGSKRVVRPESKSSWSYEDIHRPSFEEIVQG